MKIQNLLQTRELQWISPHEALARALNLPERSILPPTKHLRTFACKVYVRIPNKDRVKARKAAAQSREGIFLGMEGLRGHIYVIWVPELGRIVRS